MKKKTKGERIKKVVDDAVFDLIMDLDVKYGGEVNFGKVEERIKEMIYEVSGEMGKIALEYDP